MCKISQYSEFSTKKLSLLIIVRKSILLQSYILILCRRKFKIKLPQIKGNHIKQSQTSIFRIYPRQFFRLSIIFPFALSKIQNQPRPTSPNLQTRKGKEKRKRTEKDTHLALNFPSTRNSKHNTGDRRKTADFERNPSSA